MAPDTFTKKDLATLAMLYGPTFQARFHDDGTLNLESEVRLGALERIFAVYMPSSEDGGPWMSRDGSLWGGGGLRRSAEAMQRWASDEWEKETSGRRYIPPGYSGDSAVMYKVARFLYELSTVK